MGRDDHLRPRLDELPEHREERELPGPATAVPRARRGGTCRPGRAAPGRSAGSSRRATGRRARRRTARPSSPSSCSYGRAGQVAGEPRPVRVLLVDRGEPASRSGAQRRHPLREAEEVLGAQEEPALGAGRPGQGERAGERADALERRSSAASALPAAIARDAIATASRIVDLPEPFSPTNIVTGVSKLMPGNERIAGRSRGSPPCWAAPRCAGRRSRAPSIAR